MNFHCLFEQSGTFKRVLKAHGHNAFDYDILNEYGQTDFVIDLFEQIDKEYDNLVLGGGNETIFTKMNKDNDFIIAFFPCTHFCDANQLQYRLYCGGKKLNFDEKAVKRLIKRNEDRAKFFELYLKFTYICKAKGIPTIIENPASSGDKNYLVMFSPIEVGWHEKDRSLFGDSLKKPTNFFAINFDMKESFSMFNPSTNNIVYKMRGCKERSEISQLYVENFYKRFLENKI